MVMSEPVQRRQERINRPHGIKRVISAQTLFSPCSQRFHFVYKYADQCIRFLVKHSLYAAEHSRNQLAAFAEELASQRMCVDFNQLALREMLSQPDG